MKQRIAREEDKQTWNAFVQEHGPRSGRFLHSWGWGDFQQAAGHKVERLVLGDWDGVALVQTKQVRGFGSYRYIARGPIMKHGDSAESARVLGKHFFLRADLPLEGEEVPGGWKKSIELQPAHTLITDLSESEEVLLKNMHHKTRYNIRLAEKKGVHVSIAPVDFGDIAEVFEQTATRDKFNLHSMSYYEKMLETLSQTDCRVFVATALYENVHLAANIMIDFGDTRTYLHGASSNEYRNVMAPYLLQWELMKDAKASGLRYYDWWGVAPEGAIGHAWSGISRFKRGFGGEEVAYVGTVDAVRQSMKYYAYVAARRLRRMV